MEEQDVEIIQPDENDWKKNIKQPVKLSTFKVQTQTIIINNEPQVIEENVVCLVCPVCGAVIQQFQPGISKIEVLKSLNTDDDKKLNLHMFCSHCGQKLSLFRMLPAEGTYEVVNVEEEIER